MGKSDRNKHKSTLRIGIDIGGTFTDFVVFDPFTGDINTFKLLSTPGNLAEVVLNGLQRIFEPYVNKEDIHTDMIHGSTVATNALLERKGARTAFVTTAGFRDMLQIGRQNRTRLYDFFWEPPPPIISQELRFEVDERTDHHGKVLQELNIEQIDPLLEQLKSLHVTSVAICLLFSFVNPEHERVIAQRMRQAGFYVSVSSEVLPEYREYERASTTAVDAYVNPVLGKYLGNLEEQIDLCRKDTSLRIMQSNGGTIRVAEARRNGVRCILSGPAGGVVGARYVSEKAGSLHLKVDPGDLSLKILTFDMGGTSTDVSLVDGEPHTTTEALVGGYPIRVPVLDIHTIGAGGGSIAYVDLGGALRVGPESAGADPGPACYGKGELPTVTDANLVLGRLAPEFFLGGKMALHVGRAFKSLTDLGREINLDPVEAALGVIAVVNAHMERALRVISVERGFDPRDFTLVSFGGAGGLHAADLARHLDIHNILVPPYASTLSAFGMLAASVVKDYTQTVMLAGGTPLEDIYQRLEPLVARGLAEVREEGVPSNRITVQRFLDMRYQGQSYELRIPYSRDVLAYFHSAHNRTFGYSREEQTVEIVNVHVRVIGQVSPPPLKTHEKKSASIKPALMDYRTVILGSNHLGGEYHNRCFEPQKIPFYRGEELSAGVHFHGPAVVVRSDTTVLVGPSDRAEVDSYGNLIINVGRE